MPGREANRPWQPPNRAAPEAGRGIMRRTSTMEERTITVTLLLFAYLREIAGGSPQTRVVPAGTTVAHLWEQLVRDYPAIAPHGNSVVCAVNQDYAPFPTVLHDGDEVALLPPVSGGERTEDCWITDQPLDAAEIAASVVRATDGGVVTFEGVVRNNSEARAVLYLEYEAYIPLAVQSMREIAVEAAQRWPETRLVMAHRTGKIEISEASVVVVAASPHRLQAFQACQFGIDTLKQRVPIWKKEHFADGSVWKDGVPL